MFHLNRRNTIGLLSILIVILALPLLYLHLNSPPLELDTTNGTATIVFSSDHSRILFPGQCIHVSWNVQGIKAIYLNDKGRIGTGEQELCTIGIRPTLHVEFQDGTTDDYRLPVEMLYRQPLVMALFIGLIATLATLAYVIFGTSGLLVVLTVVIFGPMLRSQLNLGQDYIDHTMFAALGMQDFNNLPPHFLYHISVLALYDLLAGITLEQAGFIVMLAAYIATALVVLAVLRWMIGLQPNERKLSLIYVFVALGLLLIGPISVFSDNFNPAEYDALIYPNVYHNPTVGLLKPIALLLFFGIMRLLAEPGRYGWRFALGLAALTVLATFAKPSYTMVLVPAAVLMIGYNLIRPFQLNWKIVILGILIPAAMVLGWQYLFLYGPQSQSRVYAQATHIVFAPLELYLNSWKVPAFWLLPELLLSIAFPLVVYAVYFKNSRQDAGLNLAWLIFGGGLTVAYLFVEIPGTSNGNLTWSAEISIFILFVVSTGFLLRQNVSILRSQTRFDWRFGICTALFAIQLLNRLLVLVS